MNFSLCTNMSGFYSDSHILLVAVQLIPNHTITGRRSTESKEGHFAKLKWPPIAKLHSYREALNLRGAMAPWPPIAAAYAQNYNNL